MKEYIYKDNLIVEHNDNGRISFAYYLYDEDGGINEYFASTLDEAKAEIDNALLYNAVGELIAE